MQPGMSPTLYPPQVHSVTSSRCLLGFMQGGFIPDVILYLSYFYTKNELPYRLAWFWVSNYADHIVGAFLAIGILRLRHTTGRAGWRWLFLIEGVLTLVVGITSFFMMPPAPTKTKAWFRPKGWFDEREEKIIVNRCVKPIRLSNVFIFIHHTQGSSRRPLEI